MAIHISNRFIFSSLVVFRVILVIAPQTGYVHPDEIFQSIEVYTGKLFEVSANVPWEYNSTYPLRSVAVSYSTIGASLKLLKSINYMAKEYLNIDIVSSYFLVVFPRLLMCCLSFIVDYCMYKMCVNNNEKYMSKILVLASSYVMVIYGTRTFSNTLELILFSLLLYFVAESLTFSNTVNKKRDYINMRYRQSKTIVDKIKWNRLSTYLKSDTLRNCFIVSTITVFGVFNRPTFLAYAIGPVFMWIYRGIGCKSVAQLQFHWRSLMFIICAIPSLICVVVFDSFYYGHLTWGEIGMLEIGLNNFVFAPFNFIKYNANPKNLEQHGLHPRWLHLLVNIPLLFNMMGILAVVEVVKFAYRFFKCQYNLLPSVRSIKGLMMISSFAPVAILSVIPHQEPRFLIPLLFPLTYLHSTAFFEESETALVKINKRNKRQVTMTTVQRHSSGVYKFWVMLNVIFVVFYGFVHQAGVIPATSHIAKEMENYPTTTKFHVITSHIYPIPESFLLQPDPNKLHVTNNVKYNVNKRCYLHERGSADLEVVVDDIKDLLNSEQAKIDGRKSKYYFLLPSSLGNHFKFLLDAKKMKGIKATKIVSFFPHISVEALPDYNKYCIDFLPFSSCDDEYMLSWRDYIFKLVSISALDLYQLSKN